MPCFQTCYFTVQRLLSKILFSRWPQKWICEVSDQCPLLAIILFLQQKPNSTYSTNLHFSDTWLQAVFASDKSSLLSISHILFSFLMTRCLKPGDSIFSIHCSPLIVHHPLWVYQPNVCYHVIWAHQSNLHYDNWRRKIESLWIISFS